MTDMKPPQMDKGNIEDAIKQIQEKNPTAAASPGDSPKMTPDGSIIKKPTKLTDHVKGAGYTLQEVLKIPALYGQIIKGIYDRITEHSKNAISLVSGSGASTSSFEKNSSSDADYTPNERSIAPSEYRSAA